MSMLISLGEVPFRRARRLFCALVFVALSLALSSSVAVAPGKAYAQVQADAVAAAADGSGIAAASAAPATLSKYEKAAKKRKAKKRPLIAIVNKSGSRGLIGWFKHCGCDAVLISSASKLNVKKYDGLALPGGADVTPRYYKAKKNGNTHGCEPANDRLQIRAVKKFKKAGKPILGICRGAQVINVALGGTLKQHIAKRHYGKLKVKIQQGSWLYKAYGKTERVWHNHHQCVKKLGRGLIATQWNARDKLIEAIQHETLPIFGVQWHPESTGKKGRKVGRLFKKECLALM